jgi:hypothetical protein
MTYAEIIGSVTGNNISKLKYWQWNHGSVGFDVKTSHNYVGFEVLTAVVMKSIIFWDMTPCSPLTTRRHIPEDATLLIIKL